MALAITDALLHRAVESLETGGWRYTRRQLYYATCAEAELPPSNAAANGEAGMGVLLILLGIILFNVRPVGLVIGSFGVVLLLAGLASRLRRPVLHGRLLALSYEEFCARIASLELPGMLIESQPGVAGSRDAPLAAPAPESADATTAIVCDIEESAGLVRANLEAAALTAIAVRTAGELDGLPQRVVCLHDASPAGCALVAAVRDEGSNAIDAGLRPRALRDDAHEQVLQGAAARLPRDLSGVLDEAEIDWLRSGRRVELATRTPEQVMAALREAIERGG